MSVQCANFHRKRRSDIDGKRIILDLPAVPTYLPTCLSQPNQVHIRRRFVHQAVLTSNACNLVVFLAWYGSSSAVAVRRCVAQEKMPQSFDHRAPGTRPRHYALSSWPNQPRRLL